MRIGWTENDEGMLKMLRSLLDCIKFMDILEDIEPVFSSLSEASDSSSIVH